MTKQWKLSKCLWQQNLVHVYASKLETDYRCGSLK